MTEPSWPEAANRKLRAFLWKGWDVHQMAAVLGRPADEIRGQMRRLGLTRRFEARGIPHGR